MSKAQPLSLASTPSTSAAQTTMRPIKGQKTKQKGFAYLLNVQKAPQKFEPPLVDLTNSECTKKKSNHK